MELGEKLRQARLRAGLSQRQLCSGEITRNMLSQIEHGTCNPSVSTLCYLARQLNLPVSYFLEEESVASSNGSCMEQAWAAFEAGDAAGALRSLERYRAPDSVYDREYAILKALALLCEAEANLDDGRVIYAQKLLSQVQELEQKLPWLADVAKRRRQLQARMGKPVALEELPSLDEELMLYAQAALESGAVQPAGAMLDACQDQALPRWQLLRARVYLEQAEYAAAAKLLQEVEPSDPDQAVPLLEKCFSALGDYRSAYYYACKGRK